MINITRRTWWAGAVLLTLLTVVMLGLFLQRERQITGGAIGAPLDDAWIHFQFARNISRGDGFSYNPGQPTPGSTAPLWTLLLAAGGLLTDDYLPLALALSALFFVATLLLAYGFTGWVTQSWWAAMLAGIGVALSGRLLWAGLAGMETTAFAAFSLAAIWLYSRGGLTLWTALLFGLSSQLRPEGHALFALALADTTWRSFRIAIDHRKMTWTRLMRELGPPMALYLVLALPYSIFGLSTTGKPLPNTFYAKVGSEHLLSLRTLFETVSWHWRDNPVAVLLAAAGLWPLWKRSRLAVLWLLALPVLTAVIIDFTWHHGRYTMPLIPVVICAAATGAHWLVGLLPQTEQAGSHTARAAQIVLALLLMAGGAWTLSHWAAMLGTNTREIEEIDVTIGRWLADNTPTDALIAVDDIGAITFLSERRIVDMNGLVSPEVWPALALPEGLPRDQALTRILSEGKPDYMAAFPLWRWNIATNSAVAKPLFHARTDSQTIIFQQDAYVYGTTWPYVSEAFPARRTEAVFGEALALLGADWNGSDPAVLTLYWQSLVPVDTDYDIFIHLLDTNGTIVAQSDGEPLAGLAATSIWQTADIIRDPHALSLPEELAPGEYEIQVGVYLREDGRRLPVGNGRASNDALSLGTITLP